MACQTGSGFSSLSLCSNLATPNLSSSLFRAEVLVLILDVNWQSWIKSILEEESKGGDYQEETPENKIITSAVFPPSPPINICSMCSAVFQFLRAYGLFSSLRKVAIVATHSTNCEMIFEGYLRDIFSEMESDINSSYTSEIYSSLWSFIQKSDCTVGDSILATAISISLCYINKVYKEGVDKDGRIIIIDCSYENAYSSQYIPLMNCAFTASKNKVIIDTCAISLKPSSIPEQLCHITGGLYLKLTSILSAHPTVDAELALTQLLLFHFLPCNYLRDKISLVTHKNRANSAVCFCHNNPISIPTVCSCCLALYCSEKDTTTGRERHTCNMCKARFTKALVRNKRIADVDLSEYS